MRASEDTLPWMAVVPLGAIGSSKDRNYERPMQSEVTKVLLRKVEYSLKGSCALPMGPTEGQKSGSATKEWTETGPKAGNSNGTGKN